MMYSQTPATPEEWRRLFVDRIMELANYEADTLQVEDWAIHAQQTKGHRDPVAVTTEEFETGTPPAPD